MLACAAVAQGGVDARFVGAWTAKAGETTFLWEVCESGAYMIRVEGETPLPGEYGTLEAGDGRWTLRATSFRMDQGTYAFDGEDKVTVVAPRGTLVWERVATAPRFIAPAKLPDRLKSIGLKESLEVARAHAAIWQEDAVLVGAHGMASAEGTFDVTGAPALNFVFHSPTTDQGLLLTATNTGEMVWLMGPTPMMNLNVPVADGFLDLPDAMKKAAAAGGPMKPINPVELRTWAGDPDRTAWKIGGNPMIAQNLFLDALTGEKLTFAQLTGTEQAAKRFEEWKKGKPVALGDDFAEWRKAADEWARKWNEGATAYEVWVKGAYRDGLRVRTAVFLYFAERKGARGTELQACCVVTNGKQLQGNRGDRLTRKPAPLPDGLIPPAGAAKVLWTLNPQVPPDHTYLQLLHVPEGEEAPRHWPSTFGYARSNIGGIFLHRGPVPKGERWLWRMIARRPGAETGVGIGGNYQSHIGAVHCDAKTGEALDPAAPTFGPTKFR